MGKGKPVSDEDWRCSEGPKAVGTGEAGAGDPARI